AAWPPASGPGRGCRRRAAYGQPGCSAGSALVVLRATKPRTSVGGRRLRVLDVAPRTTIERGAPVIDSGGATASAPDRWSPGRRGRGCPPLRPPARRAPVAQPRAAHRPVVRRALPRWRLLRPTP